MPAAIQSQHSGELKAWTKGILGEDVKLAKLASGASKKTIYRIQGIQGKRILALHTPPPENLKRYEHARELMAKAGLRVPKTYQHDMEMNFAIIEDLGDDLYRRVLEREPQQRDELYRSAAAKINKLQQLDAKSSGLPAYDEKLLDRELAFFPDWYCAKLRQKPLSAEEAQDYKRICAVLKHCFLVQPQVVIHRDYHSENLLAIDEDGPGVVDFAAALTGPQAFDMACLLRDIYIDIEDEAQLDCLIRQWEEARQLGLPVAADFSDHYESFELTSLQRLVKVLGQFVWLHLELGQPRSWLEHLPRAAMRIHAIALRYRELRPLALMIEARPPQ